MKKALVLDTLKVIENSSNVAKVGMLGNDLVVEFQGGGIYQYENVGGELFEEMAKAESVGKFLNSKIKKSFEFKKLEDVLLSERK